MGARSSSQQLATSSSRAPPTWNGVPLSLSVGSRGDGSIGGRELGERHTQQRRDDVRVRDYGDQCGKPCLFCAGPTHTRANIHRHVVPKSAICRFHSLLWSPFAPEAGASDRRRCLAACFDDLSLFLFFFSFLSSLFFSFSLSLCNLWERLFDADTWLPTARNCCLAVRRRGIRLPGRC